jgi:transcriptional regulator with XRE-family HTH domain
MNTRLKQFLAAENISQSQFADTIKVVRASVSHVLSGRNNPGYDFIKAIMTAYPALSIEWLMLGKGKMYKEAPSDLSSDRTAPSSMHTTGNLFADEELDPTIEEDFAPLTSPNFIQEPMVVPEKRILEQSFTLSTRQEVPVTQRKITKIIAFFDDGSFQEMQ